MPCDDTTPPVATPVPSTGASEEVAVQTRWKDRDGEPTIVEASHLSRAAVAEPAGDEEAESPDAAE